MKVTILGSGTSSGVPRIGADGPDWGDCDPNERKNHRRRVSVLVQSGGKNVLIDTSPDLRAQLLDAGIGRLDAVLYTHDHADHAHGIDELRQVFFNNGHRVNCYASPATWAVLRGRFDYVFQGANGYPATCLAIDMPDELVIGAMRITSFRQLHGPIDTLGFRIECDGHSFAYSTDIKELPKESENAVRQLDLWIVDALRRHPHPTHSHLGQTLQWIERFQPRSAVVTHMDNSMDYAQLVTELPPGVQPGYDGMVFDFS
jgi:phosphoribosyl 1,2-cyclic phosphate phosphodiesterase